MNGLVDQSPFAGFEAFANTDPHRKTCRYLAYDEVMSSESFLVNYKYFEVDLGRGEHHIRVEYVAHQWVYADDWLNEYSFRYSLSPARYWRSFGSLELTVDNRAFGQPLELNVGAPVDGKTDSIAVWHFDSLPADFLQLSYLPPVSRSAQRLISTGPGGLTFIAALIILLLHALAIRRFRKTNAETKYSWVVILGSFINPLLILICYVYTYDLIDAAIGEHASGRHGYTFLAFILYPFLLMVYWVIAWILDKSFRRWNK